MGMGIMKGLSTTVDVRDMVCAQALAVVAQALGRLPAGGVLEVRSNAPDVTRDLLAWGRDRGHAIRETTATTLHVIR